MKRNAVIYAYPFCLDIVLFLALFVGRHSLAGRGFPESTVGSVLLCYGVAYCIASLSMRYLVRPHRAKAQMLLALLVIFGVCLALARLQEVRAIQAMFCVLPLAVSLFINAFQAFMLGVATDTGRPVAATAGHYTFSWSMGFALGPMISGAMRVYFEWSQIYDLAAVLTAALAVLVAVFEPVRGESRAQLSGASQAASRRPPTAGRDLMGPAWLGVALAWIAWNAISTWWAVQAAQAGYSGALKGGVEFAFALTQALGALLLIRAGAWQQRPLLIPLLGAFGVAGLLLFGVAAAPLTFIVAAVLLGLHTSSVFSLMLYHSLSDPAQAVRRVALNETIVGLCFLTAPLVAVALHREGEPFGAGTASLAGLLAVGLLVQGVWARSRSTGSAAVPGDVSPWLGRAVAVAVVAVIVTLGVFVLRGGDPAAAEEGAADAAPPATAVPGRTGAAPTRLQTATLTIPGEEIRVTLAAGQASFEVAPGSATRGRVWLVPGMAALWEGKGRSDLAAAIAIDAGGSGTFYHLVLFDASGDRLRQRSDAFLGDRVEVTRIGIGELVHDPEADYRITVQTHVRRGDEPLAARPTVPETRTFYVTRQRLEEVEVGRDDT